VAVFKFNNISGKSWFLCGQRQSEERRLKEPKFHWSDAPVQKMAAGINSKWHLILHSSRQALMLLPTSEDAELHGIMPSLLNSTTQWQGLYSIQTEKVKVPHSHSTASPHFPCYLEYSCPASLECAKASRVNFYFILLSRLAILITHHHQDPMPSPIEYSWLGELRFGRTRTYGLGNEVPL